jgi:hypothetical protein
MNSLPRTQPSTLAPESTIPALSSPIPREIPESTDAQTLRLSAETVRLLAEANESRARQLRELEQIGAWLQRDLAKEAARLQVLDADLSRRQALGSQRLSREAAGLKNQTETQTGETAQSLAEAEARHAQADAIQALVWPSPVRSEAWRPWRDRLATRAAADGPAGILFARMHTAAALERAGRPFTLELVRDLGRAIYEVGGEDADKLAQAFTQAAGGRFEIRTVRVGDRIDHKFMKPSAGGLVEVQSVSGWAIRDANGIWQFPAEVG